MSVDFNQLNIAWKECYSDNVAVSIENLSFKEEQEFKQQYAFGSVLQKIDALISEGKKICLFIGRRPHEKLPTEQKEAKPDEIWVSGDISLNGAIPENRYHLWLDFNEPDEHFLYLRAKFDLIVVDQATMHFLTDDFARRFSFMLRDKESKMVFPAICKRAEGQSSSPYFDTRSYCLYTPFDVLEKVRRWNQHYAEYQLSTTLEDQKKDWDHFMLRIGNAWVAQTSHWSKEIQEQSLQKYYIQDLGERAGLKTDDSAMIQFGKDRLKAHLQRIFENVVFSQSQNYPYLNSSGMAYQQDYFIVSSPKQ